VLQHRGVYKGLFSLALPPEEEKEKIGRIVKLLLYAEHFDDGKRSSKHSAQRAKENSPPIYRWG